MDADTVMAISAFVGLLIVAVNLFLLFRLLSFMDNVEKRLAAIQKAIEQPSA